MTENKTEDTMIAALLREREALTARGLDDRVAQVDEQLTLRGYKPAGSTKRQEPADGDKQQADSGDDARQTPPKSPKPSGARQQTRAAD